MTRNCLLGLSVAQVANMNGMFFDGWRRWVLHCFVRNASGCERLRQLLAQSGHGRACVATEEGERAGCA